MVTEGRVPHDSLAERALGVIGGQALSRADDEAKQVTKPGRPAAAVKVYGGAGL